MQIWVDGDACPVVVKEILFRAAERTNVPVILVANQPLRTPNSEYIKTVRVAAGFDVADDYIVNEVIKGDLVITADIPLASQVIEKGARVISPRGEALTPENIKARLTMRNFMEEMRSSGQVSGGPPPLSKKDRQVFANELDRFLSRAGR
ncbi:MAG: YaiI/YqxD family protein [Gammaproteobacteria bacterium]|nr:YaiI/YqxD family protein [Gammaproteobacteria bacterium]